MKRTLMESVRIGYIPYIRESVWDAVSKLASKVRGSKLVQHAPEHAKQLVKDLASNEAKIQVARHGGPFNLSNAKNPQGIEALKRLPDVAKHMGLKKKFTVLSPKVRDMFAPVSTSGNAPEMMHKYVKSQTGLSGPTHAEDKAIHNAPKKVMGMLSDAGNRAKQSIASKLGKVIGHDKSKRMVGNAAETMGKVGSAVAKHAGRIVSPQNSMYFGSFDKAGIASKAAGLAPHGPVGVAVGAGVGGWGHAKAKMLAAHPDRNVRKAARKILAGRHVIANTTSMPHDLGVLSHELGHARNTEQGLHVARAVGDAAAPGVGTLGEEALASLRAKKAIRKTLPKSKADTRHLQTALHSYTGNVGVRSIAGMESSRVTVKRRMLEALSEERRKKVPKSQFVAPSKKREGHSDSGLYPIFDRKSALSAIKLSGKHPELREKILRRAAKYGVGPYANKE